MSILDDKFNMFIKNYLMRKAIKVKGQTAKRIIVGLSLSIELISKTLLVGCNKLQTIVEVVESIDTLCQLAECIGLEYIRVYYRNMLTKIINVKDSMVKLDFQSTPEYRYLNDLWTKEKGYQTIVRMDNGIVLAASCLPDEDEPTGIGLNAKRVWKNEEWEKRNEYLLKDKILVGYEYKGYTKKEIDNPLVYPDPKLYDYSLNSQIIEYFGQECILSSFERI